VVTNLGILEPGKGGELFLAALHPGVTVEEAQVNTGWPLKAAEELRHTLPPTEEELHILREELDPNRIYLS
jgi:glutaconate CoA-transferase subunit B